MSSYKPCRVAQPKYMPCQVAHSQHKPCNLAEPLPTHLLRCLVAKGPCSSCKSCPRRLQALSSGLAYAQALSLGREVSKPCHLFRLFQISSGVLLPKAPVVPVTPAPDPHGWRSEHNQSIFRACPAPKSLTRQSSWRCILVQPTKDYHLSFITNHESWLLGPCRRGRCDSIYGLD